LPASHCTSCNRPIRWFDNVPVLSYLLLRGRCRDCGERFSPRYLYVELLTGIAFVWIGWRFGWTYNALIAAFLFSSLLVVSIVDLDFQIIPDEISLGGLVVGLVASTLLPGLHGQEIWWRGFLFSLIGALVGGGLIYVTGALGTFVFKKDAMGGGDIKLVAMLGAFLGWEKSILIFLLAPMLALPMGLFLKFVKRKDVIPFGPFLSLAGWIGFLWGGRIIRWYLYGVGF